MLKEKNRREAFRLFLGQDVTVRILNSSLQLNNTKGILKDISTLGMAVIIPYKLNLGDCLSIVYRHDYRNQLTLIGKVVRVEELQPNRYLHGCQFSSRNELLGKLILKKQIEIKRRKAKRASQV